MGNPEMKSNPATPRRRAVACASSRWICDACHKPIRDGTGYIEVRDAKTGDYPRGATPDGTQLTDAAIAKRIETGRPTEEPFGMNAISEIADTPPAIAFNVFHARCDDHNEVNPYWFAVERANTLEKWCSWVVHLCEKTWMGKRDVKRMIAFWFRNRGRSDFYHLG